MERRDFLKTTVATAAAASTLSATSAFGQPEDENPKSACCERTYATPADAMKAPPETVCYVPVIYTGSDIKKPDYLATIDLNPKSETYSQVVSRLPMPNVGDELHHFGWNSCSSCHGQDEKNRRYIVLPGIVSGRIHIVDTADERNPKLHKVIEGTEIAKKLNLSAPHTVHCLADGNIMISMLGDAQGEGPGGFMLLDEEFNIKGRWENDATGMKYNYDCLLYTSPSPRDLSTSRMPSSA